MNSYEYELAWLKFRAVIKNERIEERCARLWADAIAKNDSFQKKQLRIMQNKRRVLV